MAEENSKKKLQCSLANYISLRKAVKTYHDPNIVFAQKTSLDKIEKCRVADDDAAELLSLPCNSARDSPAKVQNLDQITRV